MSSAIPLPDPPLTDGVVELRPWAVADAPVLAAAWADPEVVRWCQVPSEASAEAAEAWIAGGPARRDSGASIDLAVTLDGAVVGEVGIGPIQWERERAALGFWLCAEHRRTGLAARAVRLVSPWALESLPLSHLVANASAHNPASGWTLAAAGFQLRVEQADRQAWVLRA